MSHTPGPWVFITTKDGEKMRDEYERPFSIVLPDCGSYPEDIICEVWGAEHDDEANARLIAVAPDLLETCLAFCDTLAFTPSSIPGAIERDLNRAYEMGRAALRKLREDLQ